MLQHLTDRLSELAEADLAFDVFGSWKHRYVSTPASPQLGFELPDQYAQFVSTVGFGAGPAYGLLEPAPLSCAHSSSPRRSLSGEPFPLTEAWCNVDEPAWELSRNPFDGCIRLVSLGCGYFDLLVLNGPRRGEVWTDWIAVAGGGKLEPKATSFFQWFDDWLDRAFEEWATKEIVRVARGSSSHNARVMELTARFESAPSKWGEWRMVGYRRLLDRDIAGARMAFAEGMGTLSHNGPTTTFWLAVCDLERLVGDDDARLAAAERGLERLWSTDHARLMWEKADVLFRQGHDEAAIRTMKDRALTRNNGKPDSILECVAMLRERGRHAQVESLLDAISKTRIVFHRLHPAERRQRLDELVTTH